MRHAHILLLSFALLAQSVRGADDGSPMLFSAKDIDELSKNTRSVIVSYTPWSAQTNKRMTEVALKTRPSMRIEFLDSYSILACEIVLDGLQKSSPKVATADSDVRFRIDFIDKSGKQLFSASVDRFGSGYINGRAADFGPQFKQACEKLLTEIH